MTMTARARGRRAAVLGASIALVATLVPTATASAATPLPAPPFAYLDGTTFAAASNDAAAAGTPTPITPNGYPAALGHDASWDGRTWAGCISSGTATTDPYDRTYGLVLVHSDGTTTTSRTLSTFCEGNPVVSPDGSKVYWVADDTVYRFDASYASGISGASSVVSTGQFVLAANASTGEPTEYVDALTVSRDGLSAAVLFRDVNGPRARVHASLLSTGATKPPAYNLSFTQVVPPTATSPFYFASSDSFVFVSDTQLAYTVRDLKAPDPSVVLTGVVTVPGASDAASAAVPAIQAGYDNTYDLRPYGDAAAPTTVTQWYLWRHTLVGSAYEEQLGSSPDFVTAPVGWAKRADGSTTARYIPTAVAAPRWTGAVSNLAGAHPTFRMLASTVPYARQVGYQSFNLYQIDPLTSTFTASTAAEVDRGLLERSYDGVHWSVFTTTSGKNVKQVGATFVYGYTPKLVRNTWWRWTYKGDLLTAAAARIVRVVKVVPTVTAKVSRRGTKRIVSGAATRQYGKAVLWRKVRSVWRVVASASISSRGLYTFGKRALARGTYRVTTIADKSWAAGVKLVAI